MFDAIQHVYNHSTFRIFFLVVVFALFVDSCVASSNAAEAPAENAEVALSYTDEEFLCMSRNIYYEAGREPHLGMIAVGQVVMNRVRDTRYPFTICGVVEDDRQFSWYNDNNSATIALPKNRKSWIASTRAAYDVIYGDMDPEVEFPFRDLNVLWYHADYVEPYWAASKTVVVKIGHHIFYK